MKKIFFFSLVVLFVLSCKSVDLKNLKKEVNYVPYYLKVYEADSLYLIKEYEECFEILDSLFREKNSYNVLGELNIYLETAYFLNKDRKVKKILKTLIQDFGYQGIIFKSDSLYNQILLSSNMSEKKIQRMEYNYINKLNLQLLDSIELMMIRDQNHRVDNNKNFNLMLKDDSINALWLKKILKSQIMPTQKEGVNVYVKGRGGIALDLSTILLHVKDSLRRTYFEPIVLDNLIKGRCAPTLYANMIDRSSLFKSGVQIYGTYFEYNKDTVLMSDLKYGIEKTNNIRKSIGLYPIKINNKK